MHDSDCVNGVCILYIVNGMILIFDLFLLNACFKINTFLFCLIMCVLL